MLHLSCCNPFSHPHQPRLTHLYCSSALGPCHTARLRVAGQRKNPPPIAGQHNQEGKKAHNQVLHWYQGTKEALVPDTFTSNSVLAVLPWYHHITLKACEENLFVLVNGVMDDNIHPSLTWWMMDTGYRWLKVLPNHKWIEKCNWPQFRVNLRADLDTISVLINFQLASTVIFFSSSHCTLLPRRDVLQKSSWFIETSKPLLTSIWFSILPCQRAQSWKSWFLYKQNEHAFACLLSPLSSK